MFSVKIALIFNPSDNPDGVYLIYVVSFVLSELFQTVQLLPSSVVFSKVPSGDAVLSSSNNWLFVVLYNLTLKSGKVELYVAENLQAKLLPVVKTTDGWWLDCINKSS